MKAMVFAGCATVLAAAGGWAAEVPAAATVGVGAPTPLTPAPGATSPVVSIPVYSPRPRPVAKTTRYPVTVLNPYHPHWVIEVVGR